MLVSKPNRPEHFVTDSSTNFISKSFQNFVIKLLCANVNKTNVRLGRQSLQIVDGDKFFQGLVSSLFA